MLSSRLPRRVVTFVAKEWLTEKVSSGAEDEHKNKNKNKTKIKEETDWLTHTKHEAKRKGKHEK